MPNTEPWGKPPAKPEPLSGNITCDVAIIGSGMTGTLTSYFLSKEGYSVAVFDDEWGGIATQCTTAFLVEAIDTSAPELILLYGQEKAALIVKAHREAIAAYEQLILNEHIECEFMRCPFFLYANEGSDGTKIKE